MRRKRSRGRGQSLVEFALVLPILLLVLLGIVDGGRLIYSYNAVANAAREAGRTAIINQDEPTIRAKAAQQATGLGIPTGAPSGCPAAGGATTDASGVCIAFRSGDVSTACNPAKVGCTAIVSVKWQWQPIAPVIGNILGPLSLEATTRQAIENVCPRAGASPMALSECSR